MENDHVVAYAQYRDLFTNLDGMQPLYCEPAETIIQELDNRPDDCELGFGG